MASASLDASNETRSGLFGSRFIENFREFIEKERTSERPIGIE